jgi:hypothetical protein
MVENIREFLLRFSEEELVNRGILRGQTRILQQTSVHPLTSLMKEHNVQKLECQDCTWFLDGEGNFSNSNTYDPNSAFDYQNLHLNPRYRGYRPPGSTEPGDEIESPIAEATTLTFGLERDLQRALRANIEQLEPGLKIIDGERERTVAAGKIDITGEDKDGNLVVIELKAGTGQPNSLTQLLAYMGALGKEEQKPVRGMLVARDFHERVVWGAQAVPSVQLKEYSFRFFFKDR